MNCNTQNAKIKSITEKTLIVGLDLVALDHKVTRHYLVASLRRI